MFCFHYLRNCQTRNPKKSSFKLIMVISAYLHPSPPPRNITKNFFKKKSKSFARLPFSSISLVIFVVIWIRKESKGLQKYKKIWTFFYHFHPLILTRKWFEKSLSPNFIHTTFHGHPLTMIEDGCRVRPSVDFFHFSRKRRFL